MFVDGRVLGEDLYVPVDMGSAGRYDPLCAGWTGCTCGGIGTLAVASDVAGNLEERTARNASTALYRNRAGRNRPERQASSNVRYNSEWKGDSIVPMIQMIGDLKTG